MGLRSYGGSPLRVRAVPQNELPAEKQIPYESLMDEFDAECVLDAKAVLAEGPTWESASRTLLWVDIERSRICRLDPASGTNRVWQLDSRVGCAIPTSRGGVIAGTQRGLVRLDPDTEAVRALANPEADRPRNRFNDGKCDPQGRLWAGTMSVDEVAGAGSLYRVDRDLFVRRWVEGVTISNGLAWSIDGKTLYYIDTPTLRVDAFDFESETGSIANRRPVILFPKDAGYPDGMTIDAEGKLWVALWQGWSVTRWDPFTGKQIGRVRAPVERVTSCCFGGPNLETLYITTASRDMTDADWVRQPQAGGIFRATPGVTGLPAHCFLE